MMISLDVDNYVIVTGSDKTKYEPNRKILFIDCNDKYEGLTEKVIKTFSFIANSNHFDKVTHIVKLDDDIKVVNKIKNLGLSDYLGIINAEEVNREWHFGKCSEESGLNSQPYSLPYNPYCIGYGYILSRKALNAIVRNYKTIDSQKEFYEDLAVGKILYNSNIFPTNAKKLILRTFKSDDHINIQKPNNLITRIFRKMFNNK
tara:strand:- start:40 stop:648 length:609 start_codon:yes stop_codon:yes gene_type:complete